MRKATEVIFSCSIKEQGKAFWNSWDQWYLMSPVHFFKHSLGAEADHLSSIFKASTEKYLDIKVKAYGTKYSQEVLHKNVPTLRHASTQEILFRNPLSFKSVYINTCCLTAETKYDQLFNRQASAGSILNWLHQVYRKMVSQSKCLLNTDGTSYVWCTLAQKGDGGKTGIPWGKDHTYWSAKKLFPPYVPWVWSLPLRVLISPPISPFGACVHQI